ncbi:MAG: tRNA pseudouridine(13) synthase TruD [Aquificae bacterium]|nr:tRNA pseudouridine(13) synthase TruD [Aquificota bacterium]
MKIKTRPEDFFVKEIKNLDIKEKGDYAYFLLTKKRENTIDILRKLSRKSQTPLKDIGFAGLKDKEAVTQQYISIKNITNSSLEKLKNLKEENYSVEFLGFGDKAINLGEFEGNYFEIVIRDIKPSKIQKIEEKIPFVQKYGFENYFGEQRFGSVMNAEDFIIKYLIKNEYEKAMKEYLLSIKDKRRKKFMRKSWGKWEKFLKHIPPMSKAEIDMIKALKRGLSFKKAFMVLPKNIRLMFAFAYQSYLWNKYLYTFVIRYFRYCRTPFLKWELAFIKQINDEIFQQIKDLKIPALGTEYPPKDPKIKKIIQEVLESEGVTQEILKTEKIGIKLFTDFERPAFVFPQNLKILEKGDNWLKISFILPPGSYATVLLKKLGC